MRKLALIFVAFALVAVSFYGCDETNLMEPEAAAGPSFSSTGIRASSSSTFDSGDEGWTLVGDSQGGLGMGGAFWLQPHHVAAEGNPGGAVYGVDRGQGMAWYWNAPYKFLGNRSGVHGGSLEYDIKISGCGTIFSASDVILAGAGTTLVVNVMGSNHPSLEWTHYRADLSTDAEWRVGNPWTGSLATDDQIRSVLKDLQVLRIRGEYLNCGGDMGYLDNVRLVPRGQAK